MFVATPSASPAPATQTQFESLLTAAMMCGARDGRDYALDFGIDESALIRYADGAVCDEEERRHIEHVVSRNRWSQNFVVQHVKQKRRQKNQELRNAA